eukprot:156085-Lingulodinium_polyedra.AAC.1
MLRLDASRGLWSKQGGGVPRPRGPNSAHGSGAWLVGGPVRPCHAPARGAVWHVGLEGAGRG